jgi:DNA-binding transcriptional ArsR family regulator
VAALRQYLERLQTPVNSPTIVEILDRLEQLERRVEALEAARSEQRPATPPSDLEALPVSELRRLARRVIGPGGDRDPSTGKHLRRAELLAVLRRVTTSDYQ